MKGARVCSNSEYRQYSEAISQSPFQFTEKSFYGFSRSFAVNFLPPEITMQIRRLGSFLLLFFLTTGLVLSQTITDTGIIPLSPNVKMAKTKNGIPFYFVENHKPQKRLDLVLTINAGAVLEDADQNGLAHFCEHMAFNGTKNFPKQKLVDFLESTGIRFGADLNAYTNQDETVYMLTVPLDNTQSIINGVKVLRDWAAFVNYEDEDIYEERGVVIEEWRLGRGASARIQDQHMAALYNNSKYSTHDVIGDTAILRNAPYETLRRFYNTWYGPQNMALIAVGDADFSTVHDIIMKYFVLPKEREEQAKSRPTILIPDRQDVAVSIATDPEFRVPAIELMYRKPTDTARVYSDFRRQIVDGMVYNMLNNRLSESVQKPNSPLAGAQLGRYPVGREYKAFYGQATASGKNVMLAFNALLTELERAKKHGFTESELKRTKEATMARMENYYNERDKTESQQLAHELVRHVLQKESVPGIVHEYEIYQHYVPQITAEECKTALLDMITQKNCVVMVSLPSAPEYVIPTDKQITDLMRAVAAKDVAPYEDAVPLKPLIAVPPVPGTIKSTVNEPEVGAKVLTLSNGARVILKKTDFKADEVVLSAVSYGGQSLGKVEDHVTLGVASTLVDISGLGEFDNVTLMKMLQGKNVSMTPFIGMETQGFKGSSSPKDLQTMFELMYLYFMHPRIDKDAFDSWKSRTSASLANKDNQPEAVFFDTVGFVLSGNSPRAQPLTVEALDKIDTSLALKFFRSQFENAGTFTFSIVGNFDEAEMERLLKTYVASLPGKAGKATWKDSGIRPPSGTFEKTVHKGKDPKSFVLLTRLGKAEYNIENRYHLSALAEVMEIRLREKLREQAGGVYFVSVQPQIKKVPREEYFMVTIFSCQPDRVDELIAMADKELDTLQMQPVNATYTDKVREIQTKEREVAMATNEFWVNSLLQLSTEGEPFSAIQHRQQQINELTPDIVLKAAREYLNTKNVGRLVLKPAE